MSYLKCFFLPISPLSIFLFFYPVFQSVFEASRPRSEEGSAHRPCNGTCTPPHQVHHAAGCRTCQLWPWLPHSGRMCPHRWLPRPSGRWSPTEAPALPGFVGTTNRLPVPKKVILNHLQTARLAQSVEHQTLNLRAAGSSYRTWSDQCRTSVYTGTITPHWAVEIFVSFFFFCFFACADCLPFKACCAPQLWAADRRQTAPAHTAAPPRVRSKRPRNPSVAPRAHAHTARLTLRSATFRGTACWLGW